MPMFPLGVLAEILINGTWTDFSQYLYLRDGIQISGGSVDQGEDPQPAQCTFTVDNRDGRFTPNFASGAWYPWLQRNVQVRFSVTATSSSGAFYSGYRFWGSVAEWPPLSDISGNDVYVQVTASGPLRRAADGGQGSALTRYYATLTDQFIPTAYWPCEGDPDSNFIGDELGGSPMNIITGAPTFKAVSGFNGSAPIAVVNKSTWDGLTGDFGTSGDDIFVVPGSHTWVASTTSVNAKVWGAGGGGGNGTFGFAGGGGAFAQETALAVTPGQAYTVKVGTGGQGGALSNTNQNDDGADGTSSSIQGDAVLVKANGGKGGTSAAPGNGGAAGSNTVKFAGGAGGGRAHGDQAGGGGGGSAGTAAAGNAGSASSGNTGGAGGAAVTGGGKGGRGGDAPGDANIQSGATPGGGGGAGAHDPNANSAHSGLSGGPGKVELIYTPTGGGTLPNNNVIRFILFVPPHGGQPGKVLVRALTSGTIAQLDVQYGALGTIQVVGYSAALAVLFTSAQLTVGKGATVMVSAELAKSGTAVAWKLTAISPGASTAAGAVTGSQATATVGNVTEILVSPNADITKSAIGHISVQYALIDITAVSRALNGHDTELSIDRFSRLAAEQALGTQVQFSENQDHFGFELAAYASAWVATNATRAQSAVTVGGTPWTFAPADVPPGNFLASPSSDFEGGNGTWAVNLNCTLANTTAQANSPTHSLQLTSVAAGSMSAASSGNPTVTGMPVLPGQQVNVSAWFRSAVSARSCLAGVQFYTAAGSFISTLTGTGANDSTSAWTQRTASVTAPAGAAFCRAYVQVTSTGAASEVHYVDDVALSVVTGVTFVTTNANAASISPGDQFNDILNPGVVFTVGSVGGNAGGFNTVTFTPQAATIMGSADTVTQILPGPWPTDGSQSLLITAAGAAGLWGASSPTGTSGFSIQPGDTVSAAADVYAPAALGAVQINIIFYTAAGAVVSTDSGATIALAAGAAGTVCNSAKAPATAAFFAVQVADNETKTAGVLLYTDNVRINPQMGPQTHKEYKTFLKEIQTLEQGILKESKILWGLGYKTRIAMINQTAKVTLDYTAGVLSPPLTPVLDDAKTANKITVKKSKGSAVTVSLDTGTMSTQEPPAGAGVTKKIITAVAAADDQLAALAAHLLNLGTVTDERYPTVTVILDRASLPGNAVAPLLPAIANVEIGDMITLTNLPFWFPSATSSQLVIGYTEKINTSPRDGEPAWVITWNCVPESPWEVVVTSLRRW